METGLSEVIKFCTRKLIKMTHFISPLKMINLFQDIMPNFSPKNVGLEILRPVIFMINRTQLKPKIKYCMSGKHSVNLSISAGGLNLLPKKKKKNGGKGGLACKDKLKSEIFNENKNLLTKIFSSVNLNSEFSYFYKMGWGLKIKEIAYYGGSLKNLIFSVELQKSNM